jgi:hypothetical protein
LLHSGVVLEFGGNDITMGGHLLKSKAAEKFLGLSGLLAGKRL